MRKQVKIDTLKTDITMHSERELSNIIFNDEGFYNIRRSRGFLELIKECYVFTDEQWQVLIEDLTDDAESYD